MAMRLNAFTVGLLLWGVASTGSALNLGRAHGAAWIGRPLSLSVQLQAEVSTDLTALCPEAEVYYADNRVAAAKVQVHTEPSTPPDALNLRIQSSAQIDEPIVTVYVRAGCNQKITRRYVLLADYPSDNVEAPAPVLAAVATPVRTTTATARASQPPSQVQSVLAAAHTKAK